MESNELKPLFVYTSGPELSGKSEFANRLFSDSEGRFELISTDPLVKEINGNPLNAQQDQKRIESLTNKIFSDLKEAISNKRNTIFDDRMMNADERSVIFEFLRDNGANHKIISVAFNPPVLVEYFNKWKSLLNWGETRNAEMLSFISDHIKAYSPPSDVEAELRVEKIEFCPRTNRYEIDAHIWGERRDEIACDSVIKLIEFFTFVDSK